MAPSTLADKLWSVICSFYVLFILYLLEKGVSLMALEQLLLNARTRGIGWLASFLNKSVALFLALLHPISSSSPPPIFLYFTFANLKRESCCSIIFFAVNLL